MALFVGARSRAFSSQERGRAGAPPRRARARGFTIVELLVTLAIVGILMTISLSVLSRFGKKDGLEATTAGVRALLRRARNVAQEERWSTLVEIDGKASELRAQTRTTVTHFRFDVGGAADPAAGADPASSTSEPAPPPAPAPADDDDDDDRPPAPFDVPGALGYVMTVDGGEVVQGRFGQGLLFERPGAWASIEDRPALSPAEGVFIELSIYLGVLSETLRAKTGEGPSDAERAKAGLAGDPPRAPSPRIVDWRRRSSDNPPIFHAARKGKAWSIGVTADYEVEIALTGPPADGGAEVTFVARTMPDTLKPDRWHRIALAFDGARSRVVVDGIPRVHLGLVGNDALPGRLVRDRAPLTLSDPDPEAGFYGVIDELKVAAILDAQRLAVPLEVLLVAPDDAVGFDLLGQLDTGRHAEPVVIYLTDDERAYALVDPPSGPGATQTRADQERLRLATGASRYARFVAGLEGLDPNRWRAVVVERTGLVR